MAISKVNPNSLSLSGELSSGNPLVTIDSTGTSSNEGHALKVIASGRGSGVNDVSILSVHNANGELLRVQNAGGISFNGDTAAVNALDDYEEGDWTPTANNGFTGLTFDSGTCKYTKIGNTVHVWGEIYNFTGTASSIWQVSGLPFTVNKETAFNVMFQNVNLDSGYTAISGYCLEGTDDIRMYQTGDNVGWDVLLGNQTTTTTFFIFCLTYFV